jgi:predicted MFS family arabinose efflux permease
MGAILDRLGPRRVALFGAICYAAALANLGTTDFRIWTWWLGWMLVAIAAVGVSLPVWLLTVAGRFDRARGMALAVAFLGSAFASMTIPVVTRTLMNDFGWRGAYRGLGILTLLTGILPSILPSQLGHRRATQVREKVDHSDMSGMSITQSLSSSKFWRIAAACFLATSGVIALTVHFVPIMSERGLTPDRAAAVAGAMGFAGIVGRLSTGYLMDRFQGRIVAAGAYTIPMAACLLLQSPVSDTAQAILTACAIGLALGSEMDVMAYLATRYFGLRHYGLLFGILTGVVSAGAGVGPILAGLVHDRFHSYDRLGLLLGFGFGVSTVLVLTLGKYPDRSAFVAPISPQ